MYHTVDSTEVNMGPIRDYRIHMSIYYVCFVVVFAFFFINIFVALIIVTFQESGERNIQACDLDRNQVKPVLPFVKYFYSCNPLSYTAINVTDLLQVVYKLQQTCQFHAVPSFADLLQLVKTTCSKPVGNKF